MVLLCWLLRENLSRITALVFATMLAADLLFPDGDGAATHAKFRRAPCRVGDPCCSAGSSARIERTSLNLGLGCPEAGRVSLPLGCRSRAHRAAPRNLVRSIIDDHGVIFPTSLPNDAVPKLVSMRGTHLRFRRMASSGGGASQFASGCSVVFADPGAGGFCSRSGLVG
jgi:hypothetical protein